MKVRIKDYHGSLIDLTKGKVYEVISEYCAEEAGYIIDDVGFRILIKYDSCEHLKGGSWEIIKENKTMNREEAIRAMLDGKKVNREYWGELFIYYNINRGVFESSQGEGVNVNDLTDSGWKIVPERKKRPMTRNEVLGFLANTSGIVVRIHKDEWRNSGYFYFDAKIKDYEYAYIDEKGNIGEPMKFEVEE